MTDPSTSLSLTCKCGLPCIFDVREEEVPDTEMPEWMYYVTPNNIVVADEYVANFKQIEPGLLRLANIRNYLPSRYRGCGIMRALIPFVAKRLSSRIVSSSNAITGEMRTPDATKVWKRMESDGQASFIRSEDRYYYPAFASGDTTEHGIGTV